MADDKQRIDDLVNRGLLDQWYAVAKSVQVKPGKPHAVKALGRTPAQIQADITAELKSRALEPQVVVALAQQNTSLISVLGDVRAGGGPEYGGLRPGGAGARYFFLPCITIR